MGVSKRLSTQRFLGRGLVQTSMSFRSEIPRLIRRIDSKENRVLYKVGAYIRKAMQRSMRYAGKRGGKAFRSKPGEPPRIHRTVNGHASFLRRMIGFAVDKISKSVAIGPELLPSRRPYKGGTVPKLLNDGGVTQTYQDAAKTKPILIYIAPRPFVEPRYTDGGERLLQLIAKERL